MILIIRSKRRERVPVDLDDASPSALISITVGLAFAALGAFLISGWSPDWDTTGLVGIGEVIMIFTGLEEVGRGFKRLCAR